MQSRTPKPRARRVSPQTAYRAGATFERQVGAVLEEAGYLVFRVAGSRGVADLIALRNAEKLLVQVKRAGCLRVSEWNALWEIAKAVGGLPILAERHHGSSGVYFWLLTGPRAPRDGAANRTTYNPKEL